MRRALFWLLTYVPLGPFAPYVVALAMGRAAHDIQKEEARIAMERIVTLLGIIVAALALIFQIGSIMVGFVPLMLAAAVVLIGIGVLTGR